MCSHSPNLGHYFVHGYLLLCLLTSAVSNNTLYRRRSLPTNALLKSPKRIRSVLSCLVLDPLPNSGHLNPSSRQKMPLVYFCKQNVLLLETTIVQQAPCILSHYLTRRFYALPSFRSPGCHLSSYRLGCDSHNETRADPLCILDRRKHLPDMMNCLSDPIFCAFS